MKRALAAVTVTVVGVVWLVTFKVTPLEVDAVTPATPAPTRAPAPTIPIRTPPGITPAPSRSIPPGPPAASGTFVGDLISTRYGPVQVQIVVSGQKVVDVQALVLPKDRARSAAISQYSAPMLRTEAIRAQTASIDIVSGATYTSVAYSHSLESALRQAHLG